MNESRLSKLATDLANVRQWTNLTPQAEKTISHVITELTGLDQAYQAFVDEMLRRD